MPSSPKLFDAHFHIIDPAFPLQENQGYLPDPFLIEEYSQWRKLLGIKGGALVSGSFQGFDTSYMENALQKLGSGFVGVIQAPLTIADEEIMRLDALGVRAIRFNIKRGLETSLKDLEALSRRVYDLASWHVELYIDSTELSPWVPLLKTLPATSLDHLGLSQEGLPILLSLVSQGIKVKATGFGRVNFEVLPVLKQIYQENSEALLFGTDLPSTRAKRPFSPEDLQLIQENFSEEAIERILWKNSVAFYRPVFNASQSL
ncbi:MAG: amidohydrolase family protein [Chlamydiia bacterium]|nr:amidohydrolase family protein [Chlamydiia bacterium]